MWSLSMASRNSISLDTTAKTVVTNLSGTQGDHEKLANLALTLRNLQISTSKRNTLAYSTLDSLTDVFVQARHDDLTRRWAGVLLLASIELDPSYLPHISETRRYALGNTIISSTAEDVRVIAGALLRLAIAHAIPIQSFYQDKSNLLCKATFPRRQESQWIEDFEQYLQELDLHLTSDIYWAVHVVIDDLVIRPRGGHLALFLGADRITIITPPTPDNIHFVDISRKDIQQSEVVLRPLQDKGHTAKCPTLSITLHPERSNILVDAVGQKASLVSVWFEDLASAKEISTALVAAPLRPSTPSRKGATAVVPLDTEEAVLLKVSRNSLPVKLSERHTSPIEEHNEINRKTLFVKYVNEPATGKGKLISKLQEENGPTVASKVAKRSTKVSSEGSSRSGSPINLGSKKARTTAIDTIFDVPKSPANKPKSMKMGRKPAGSRPSKERLKSRQPKSARGNVTKASTKSTHGVDAGPTIGPIQRCSVNIDNKDHADDSRTTLANTDFDTNEGMITMRDNSDGGQKSGVASALEKRNEEHSTVGLAEDERVIARIFSEVVHNDALASEFSFKSFDNLSVANRDAKTVTPVDMLFDLESQRPHDVHPLSHDGDSDLGINLPDIILNPDNGALEKSPLEFKTKRDEVVGLHDVEISSQSTPDIDVISNTVRATHDNSIGQPHFSSGATSNTLPTDNDNLLRQNSIHDRPDIAPNAGSSIDRDPRSPINLAARPTGSNLNASSVLSEHTETRKFNFTESAFAEPSTEISNAPVIESITSPLHIMNSHDGTPRSNSMFESDTSFYVTGPRKDRANNLAGPITTRPLDATSFRDRLLSRLADACHQEHDVDATMVNANGDDQCGSSVPSVRFVVPQANWFEAYQSSPRRDPATTTGAVQLPQHRSATVLKHHQSPHIWHANTSGAVFSGSQQRLHKELELISRKMILTLEQREQNAVSIVNRYNTNALQLVDDMKLAHEQSFSRASRDLKARLLALQACFLRYDRQLLLEGSNFETACNSVKGSLAQLEQCSRAQAERMNEALKTYAS